MPNEAFEIQEAICKVKMMQHIALDLDARCFGSRGLSWAGEHEKAVDTVRELRMILGHLRKAAEHNLRHDYSYAGKNKTSENRVSIANLR